MTATYYYREGDTEPIDITLMDGANSASITGYSSVSVFFRSSDGSAQSEVSTADSGVTVTTPSSGLISLDPTKFTTPLAYSKGAYSGYVIVVDGTGKRSSFPSNEEFEIRMRERFSGDG